MTTQTFAPAPTVDQYYRHPLELISFFRRWPQSWRRDLSYTFIFNIFMMLLVTAINLAFGILEVSRVLWVNFVMSQCIGYAIHALYELADAMFASGLNKLKGMARALFHMLVTCVGVFVGYGFGFAVLDMQEATRWLFSEAGLQIVGITGIFISTVITTLFMWMERIRRREAMLMADRQRLLDAERRALQAQLRMLQAQIEPHFLYNTLANAVGLIQPAPERARALLEHLIDYLRASLHASRMEQAPLAQELQTLQAYLNLMALRMQSRLRFQIDCPPELAHYPIAPMLIQPLVENAISHGLEPKIEGGEIQVKVAKRGEQLWISVLDNGVGFNPLAPSKSGGGVGLSNLRERLQLIYEGKAQLILSDNTPSGLQAELCLPL